MAWRSQAMAMAWPCPRIPMSLLVLGCSTRPRCKAGSWLKGTTDLYWDITVPMSMAAGMPMGTQPVGLGLGECTGWGSHLYFSKLFVPLQKLPGSGYLQHTVTSKDMTKSQRVKHPWFGPCPQGPAQEAQLLVGFTGRRAMRLPMVLGPCHSHGQEGVKTVRQLTPNLETACAPQGTPKSFWSHPPALPVTAEQGEPLLLEIPRMS